MPAPARSPQMVGRRGDLDDLREAHLTSLSGAPRGVVVAGEAGIGKTRLLEEFLAGLGEDVVVGRGQCVASGSLGTPFAPVRGVLRDLVGQAGREAVLDAAGPAAHLLSVLVPELADAGAPVTEIAQEQLHDLVGLLLTELSRRHPLVVLVEDLHWADIATLDLLRSLLARVRDGRITLVLSYRTDDVGRHHPLRPVLAELGRARDVSRVDVRRLEEQEVAELAQRIHGRPLDAVTLGTLVERSEGVPFFVEELLGLDDLDEGDLPETLRDLVLSRYERLDDRTQAVLRLVATGGVSVPHALVELVHDGDPVDLETVVRQAIDAHVLTADETAYTFRHALTQEAVHAELLPGERVRFHARYAAALEARPDLAGSAAETAQHHLAAHDLARGLASLVVASRQAAAGAAPASAGRLGERALELWSQVPDAETLAGCRKPELFLATAQAYAEAGDERAMAILEEALAECPPEDRRHRSLLLHESMITWHDLARPGGPELSRQALEALPEGEDEQDRAVRLRVRVGHGIILRHGDGPAATVMLEDAVREGRALLSSASDPAVRATAARELARALTNLAGCYAYAADVDAALAAFEEALVVGAGDGLATLRDAEQRGWLLLELGRYEEAVEVCTAGHAASRALGQETGWGMAILLGAVHGHLALGRLDRAQRALERIDSLRSRSGYVLAFVTVARAELLLHRDDADGAAAALGGEHRGVLDGTAADDIADRITIALTDARVALARGDLGAAWSAASVLLGGDAVPPGASYALAATAAGVLAEMRRAGTPPDLDTRVLEKRLRAGLAAIPRWDVADVWESLVEAELSGPDGTGTDVAAWQAAADAAAGGRVPVAVHVHALTRLGQARVDAGDRPGATRTLEEAAGLAGRAGLPRAARLVRELVARAGLEPRTRRADGGVELTDRERQVLALVAEGLTNRQIGERLFISDKTASVHVSAILRKLGVGSRTEAAVHAAAQLDSV